MAKGTIQNKEAFLTNITEKLHKKRSTHVTRPTWNYQPQWEVYQDKTTDELCNIFKKGSEEKDTHVIETTKERLVETIQQVIQFYDGKPIVATNDERFQTYDLTDVPVRARSRGVCVKLLHSGADLCSCCADHTLFRAGCTYSCRTSTLLARVSRAF